MIFNVDTEQAKLFAAAGLSPLLQQCVVRGLDCRGAWGELIKKVEATETTKEELDVNSLESRIRSVLPPIFVSIAKCEGWPHWDKKTGEVIKGKVNPLDIGLLQINLTHNGEKAKQLGYDVFSLEGNLLMAKYLYEKNGLSDWRHSKYCWKKK